MVEYLFWFVAITHDRVPEYIKHLDKYLDPSAALIVSKETARGVHHETKGQHIHIAADMSVETYNKFHKNIHVEQLKLRRKANEKGGKQCGRVHNVRDELKMLSYTVKNNNIIYKNIDLKTIQNYIEGSYPKKEDWDNDLIQYLILNVQDSLNLDTIDNLIISYYQSNSKKKANLTRMKIKQITLRYLMYEIPQTDEVKQTIKFIL
jgi:hypothetical protein